MSATNQNHTLDDFLTGSACASCGVDNSPEIEVPYDSAIGRCMGIDSDSEVCSECFHDMKGIYRAGGYDA